MALNPSNSSNSERLALKGLNLTEIEQLRVIRLTAGEMLSSRAKLVRCEHWHCVVVELLLTTVQLIVDHSPLQTSPTHTRVNHTRLDKRRPHELTADVKEYRSLT